LTPFDFILVTTKNVADVLPSVADIIAPSVTPGTTAIVLSQNGLNIEKPLIKAFPDNPIISSISMIGAAEKGHGIIIHDDNDSQVISPFPSPTVSWKTAEATAKRYVDIYAACGKLDITYNPDVKTARWRKLVYNASFNSTAAVLRIDTARMRMSEHIIDDLIRPIMLEIVAAAKANGVELPADLPEKLIRCDPTDTAFKPSMCQDVEKGNLIEFENIVGEPLREGEAKGVAMPTLRTMYGLLKALQLKTMESRGLWTAKFEEGNPYQ
jgi:2-dehydropantoate 2-reductase